jgi:hypothetical protein
MICIFGTKVGSGVFVDCALVGSLKHASLELVAEQSAAGACLVALGERLCVVGN